MRGTGKTRKRPDQPAAQCVKRGEIVHPGNHPAVVARTDTAGPNRRLRLPPETRNPAGQAGGARS